MAITTSSGGSLDEWVKPPFDPRVEGGRVYARGAADDKGQVHLHVWAARAWHEVAGGLPVNVRYVFEGEEESGSEHFDDWLRANQHRLTADLAVISDTGFFEGNHPAITVSLRGLMYLQVDVTGPSQDLHSGTWGGNVQNPAIALARIIAAIKAPDGSVDVPGFYDEVRAITPEEHAQYARLPLDEAVFAEGIGVPELFGEAAFLPLERRGARPTLDVNGLWGGFQGEGSKTIIPPRARQDQHTTSSPPGSRRTFGGWSSDLAVPGGLRVDVRLLNDGMGAGGHRPSAAAAPLRAEGGVRAGPYYLNEAARPGGGVVRVHPWAVGRLPGYQPEEPGAFGDEQMVLANYEGGVRAIARTGRRAQSHADHGRRMVRGGACRSVGTWGAAVGGPPLSMGRWPLVACVGRMTCPPCRSSETP